MSPRVHHLTAKRKDSRKKEKPHGKRKDAWKEKKNLTAKKNKTRGKRKKLAAKEITSRSKRAFCCACSVNFSLKRETAAMRLRRFPAQESRKKRARIVRQKTTNESSI